MTVMVSGGGGLSMTFDPARGAKITSLKANGVEWLAQGNGRPVPRFGTRFVDAEMAGWDECAPSIVECTVGDYAIPDHGDLWDTPFSSSGTSVVADGSTYPYRFERKIVRTLSGLRIDYRATATKEPVPFLWAAHPQFLAPPGTRVVLEGVDSVIDVLIDPETTLIWDERTSSIDSLAPGECRKVYVPQNHTLRSARLERSEAVLILRWSDASPYLGVWFDRAAYARESVIALEPSTGFYDSLESAIARAAVAVIEPGAPLEWWVEIEVWARP